MSDDPIFPGTGAASVEQARAMKPPETMELAFCQGCGWRKIDHPQSYSHERLGSRRQSLAGGVTHGIECDGEVEVVIYTRTGVPQSPRRITALELAVSLDHDPPPHLDNLFSLAGWTLIADAVLDSLPADHPQARTTG